MPARRGASPYVSLPGGATLHCVDKGAGDPLLFVHGWTCDAGDFLSQLTFFRRTHRVIAPDLRGHGRSPVTRDGYEAEALAYDLAELLDAMGIPRVIAIGHSLGGLLVSMLAVDHPERVSAVVCLDPAYGVAGESAAACRALADDMTRPEWMSRLAAEFPAWEGPSTPFSVREQHVRRMLAMDPMVVRETFRHLFARDESVAFREHTEACFARRTCPVLAIYGRHAHERVEWEERHSNHPASRFLHLPLGHWLQQDAPDLVNRLIVDWLSTLHHTQEVHHAQEGEDIRGVISETGSCGK